MNRLLRHVAAILVTAFVAACADKNPMMPDQPMTPVYPPLTPAQAPRVAPRLAVMTFVIATGPEGRSFFDNFLPCLNRGAVSYVNTHAGRRAWFRACDLGTGVMIDGTGEIEWAASAPGPARADFCTFGPPERCETSFRWNGTLAITLDDTLTVALDTYRVNDVVVTFVGGPQLQSLNVMIGADTILMNDPELATELFDDSGRTLDAIPNPTESVAALTDGDLHRLAYQGIAELASFLLNETLESGRGDHEHTLSCGTSSVSYDAQQLPTVTSSWNACLFSGLVYDGSFTMTWGRFDVSGNTFDAIRLDLSGTLTLGGAVPRVRISSLQILMSNADGGSIEGALNVTLTLTGTGGSRSLAFTLLVDD